MAALDLADRVQKRDIDSSCADSSSSPSSFSSAVNAPSISTSESKSKSNRRRSKIFRLFNTSRALPPPPRITMSHSLPTLDDNEAELKAHTQQTQSHPKRDTRRRSLSSLRSMISGFFSRNNTSMANSSKPRKPRQDLHRQAESKASVFSLRRNKHRRASSMNAINTTSGLQSDSYERKTMESDMRAIVEEHEDFKEYTSDSDDDDNEPEFEISETAEHERDTEKHLSFARPVLTARSSSVSIRKYDKRPECCGTYYAPASLMNVFNSIMDIKAPRTDVDVKTSDALSSDTFGIETLKSTQQQTSTFAVDTDYALNEPAIDMSVLSSLPEYDDGTDTECTHWE